MSRLPPRDGERIDRGRELRFSFDGKEVTAHEGDTIGSALFASGRRTFSRSFKYHRPRGLMCCAGQCPNCLVQVGDAPGVRACTEPVREGMQVTHMNASPSLEFDVMAATDKFAGPFTPPGFYYKTFIRPRRLWPLYEKVLRHAAGLGKLRKSQPEREWRTEYRRRHADVLVVGGGAAGLSAAIAAAELGADTVLCDEGPEPGGRLLAEGGHAHARELAERAREAGVELLVERARAGRLRRPRAGLAGEHPAPGARPAPRVRHRHDRAAAAVRRQRPARRDAVRRRAPAGRALGGQARLARRGGHGLRPRPRGGAGADGRRRGAGDGGRPAQRTAPARRSRRSSAAACACGAARPWSRRSAAASSSRPW